MLRIPYLASQEVFRAIWEDSSVWAGYHHSCDHPDAVVSPWQSDERRVTFSTPLKAPAWVKKLVGQCCLLYFDTLFLQAYFLLHLGGIHTGVEVLEIIETQHLQRQAGGSLVVESRPVLAAPGASKFTTHALFSMTETVNGIKSCKVESPCVADGLLAACYLHSTCFCKQHIPEELCLQCMVLVDRSAFAFCCWHVALQIEVQITCTCSVWGMQTTVESMMVTQAEESMQKFLAWAKQRCIAFKQVWSVQPVLCTIWTGVMSLM